MAKTKYTQHFRKIWLTFPEFQKWLMELRGQSTRARCSYCKCDFGARIADIKNHLISSKHLQASELFSSPDSNNILIKIANNDAMLSTQVDEYTPEKPQKTWVKWKPASLKSEKHSSLYSDNTVIEIQQDDAVPGIQVDQNILDSSQKKPAERKLASLETKKHCDLCNPKEQCDMLRKKIIEKEMEERNLKNRMLKEEIQQKNKIYELEMRQKKELYELEKQHKKELHELEKDQMLLKIDILKAELESKRNS